MKIKIDINLAFYPYKNLSQKSSVITFWFISFHNVIALRFIFQILIVLLLTHLIPMQSIPIIFFYIWWMHFPSDRTHHKLFVMLFSLWIIHIFALSVLCSSADKCKGQASWSSFSVDVSPYLFLSYTCWILSNERPVL